MERCIVHVDMDAFFAAVEQRDHPEWRGVPLVVGAPPDRRGVVATCSYEARAFGIHSAMPSREAYRRCPHAIFVPCDMPRYAEVSRRVFDIFSRFSPWIEPVSIDEAFIDVTDCRTLFGEGRRIAERIRLAIHAELQLTASVGVAHNKFLAKLASEQAKPDGLFVMPRSQEAITRFLAPLAIGTLWGVGAVTANTLRNAGCRTVGDLQKMAPRTLECLLGKHSAVRLLECAAGRDTRGVHTESEEQSLSREHTFDEDCRDPEQVRNTLKALAEQVGQRLRTHRHYAGGGRLKLRWANFRTITRQARFSVPVCDDFALREMALRLLNAEALLQPVRLIGFGVFALCETFQEQTTLFDPPPAARAKRETLCKTVDALRAKLGRHAVGRPTPHDA